MRVAQELSERYHSACREVRMLALTESASERLGVFLLDVCAKHGTPTDDGSRLRMNLTQEEIAQQIGTTRETVSRILSDLKSKKIITQRGSMLVVHDSAALEKLF